MEDEDILIPLPVINLGGRYNITEKTQLNFRWEIFDVEFGDYEGRFQEASFLVEHNTFKHIGFGGGLTALLVEMELDDEVWRGEFETSYNGALLYLKFYF